MKMQSKSNTPKSAAPTHGGSGEGYEARTSYPVQMTQDLIADIGARVSSITKTDESNTKVITNSSEPAKLGALATRQNDVIQLAPEVSDPSKSSSAHVIAHEFAHGAEQSSGSLKSTGMIGNVKVNTDPFYENRADKVANEALK